MPPDDGGNVIKLTKRNAYGLYAVFDPASGKTGSRPASALEYLERLQWHNDLFGDDIRLLGVAENSGGAVFTLTSQPFISGECATHDEIAAFQSGLDFELLDEVLGAWIRRSDGLVMLDAVPRNVIRDEAGWILPIDIIFGRLD